MTDYHCELTTDGICFDVQVTPEEGIRLSNGVPWRGYRVRWRELGKRRWSNVLLIDHDHFPTPHELSVVVSSVTRSTSKGRR